MLGEGTQRLGVARCVKFATLGGSHGSVVTLGDILERRASTAIDDNPFLVQFAYLPGVRVAH